MSVELKIPTLKCVIGKKVMRTPVISFDDELEVTNMLVQLIDKYQTYKITTEFVEALPNTCVFTLCLVGNQKKRNVS